MSSSIFEGRLQFATAEHDADDPLSAHYAQALANNALHYADEMSQVRVAWRALSGQKLIFKASGAVVNTFYRIAAFGPFPWTLKSDGTPYVARVRLAGFSSDNTNTITLRAVLSTPDRSRQNSSAYIGDTANTMDATSASSTSAWLVGASTKMEPTKEHAGESIRRMHVITATGGTKVETVEVCMMTLSIWGSTANLAATPSLTGAYLAEYVGL
jgi:hypothetical protein